MLSWSLVLSFTACPPGLRAQGNSQFIGFKAGLTRGSARAVDVQEPVGGSAAIGYVVGILGRRPLGGRFAGQAELQLARYGADFDHLADYYQILPGFEAGDIRAFHVAVRNTYLKVGLTLQYLLPVESVDVRVFAGPSLRKIVHCAPDRTTVFVGEEKTLVGCPMSEDGFPGGFLAGGLVDLPLGGSIVTIDVRYDGRFGDMEGQTWIGAFPGIIVLPDFSAFDGVQATVGLGIPVDWQ